MVTAGGLLNSFREAGYSEEGRGLRSWGRWLIAATEEDNANGALQSARYCVERVKESLRQREQRRLDFGLH